VREFIYEAKFLSGLRHPNIVQFYGITKEEATRGASYWLVMNYCDTSLQKILEDPSIVTSTKSRISIAEQVAAACVYLHSKQVIHRDLKPDNILLNETRSGYVVKLCDFGLAKKVTGDAGSNKRAMTCEVGTPAYMAPELMSRSDKKKSKHKKKTEEDELAEYDRERLGISNDSAYHITMEIDDAEKLDVYSFGFILYAICTWSLPFQGFTPVEIITAVCVKNERPDLIEIRSTCSEEVHSMSNLIERCWQRDPSDRPTMIECLEHIKSIVSAEDKRMNTLL